jgi:hypothetical protein
LNKSRQESAVKAGLIPFLQFVINNNKPLKEFAVPLMCELAGSSQVTRSILLENNGLAFYFDLLKDLKGSFLTDALEAITVWYDLLLVFSNFISVENERERAEIVILNSGNIQLIKDAMAFVQEHELVKLLESAVRLLSTSVRLNKEIGKDTSDTSFVSILKKKLNHPAPHARVNLLKSLNLICSKCSDPPHFLKNNALLKVVKCILFVLEIPVLVYNVDMATNDSSLLVRNMAQQLLKDGGKEK